MRFIAILLLATVTATAQQLPVVVKEPAAGAGEKPVLLYITGDGGMKKFSQDLVNNLAGHGYPVVALNALKYFWSRKTPQQAAADVAALMQQYGRRWNNHAFILAGYSMGADVLPVIYLHLPAALQAQTRQLVLLSPSRFTDLEVHLSGMLGKNAKGGINVTEAINAITTKPLLLLFGESEQDFDHQALTIHNYRRLVLPGGHRYNEDAGSVARAIIAHLHTAAAP